MGDKNPLEKLATLGKVLKERAEDLDLEMRGYIPICDLTEAEIHGIQGVFAVDLPNDVMASSELTDDERALQGILAATEEQERLNAQETSIEASNEDYREKMRKRLESGDGGFLD